MRKLCETEKEQKGIFCLFSFSENDLRKPEIYREGTTNIPWWTSLRGKLQQCLCLNNLSNKLSIEIQPKKIQLIKAKHAN